MAKLVAGYALSHSSFMVSEPELVSDSVRERCFNAYERVRRDLQEVDANVLVILGTDHFNSYFYDLFPQWCVGRGETYEGWGDNMPTYTVRGDSGLGRDIVRSLLDSGCEPSFSDSMRLDHSFFGPLHFLTPNMDIPVVPIFQNCITPPFPRLRRSFELGKALRRAIANSPSEARVAVIGSGGLSHWLGGPEHGRLNPRFDEEFLGHFEENDVDWLTGFTDDMIEDQAGNGGHEIRNWLTVRGALGAGKVERYYYEALYPWFVGAAVVKVTPEGDS